MTKSKNIIFLTIILIGLFALISVPVLALSNPDFEGQAASFLSKNCGKVTNNPTNDTLCFLLLKNQGTEANKPTNTKIKQNNNFLIFFHPLLIPVFYRLWYPAGKHFTNK